MSVTSVTEDEIIAAKAKITDTCDRMSKIIDRACGTNIDYVGVAMIGQFANASLATAENIRACKDRLVAIGENLCTALDNVIGVTTTADAEQAASVSAVDPTAGGMQNFTRLS